MSQKDINEIFDLKRLTNQEMHIPIELGPYTNYKCFLENPTSVVLYAHDQALRKILIKCIPIQYFQSNEVTIMKNLNEKHIIPIIDSFFFPKQNPRFYAIVMPNACGYLLNYLKYNGYLPEAKVCQIMKELMTGLQVLHSFNIWHRNLSLESILVMNETYQKISVAIYDFKDADLIDTPTVTTKAVGNYQYSAPELLEISNKKLHFIVKATCMLKKFNHKKS